MGCRRRCRRHPKTLTPRAGTELGSIPLMKAPASLHNFQPFFCRSGAGWGGMHGVGARAITRSGGVRGALAAHFPPPRPPISSKNEPCVLPPNPPARECFSSGAGGKKKKPNQIHDSPSPKGPSPLILPTRIHRSAVGFEGVVDGDPPFQGFTPIFARRVEKSIRLAARRQQGRGNGMTLGPSCSRPPPNASLALGGQRQPSHPQTPHQGPPKPFAIPSQTPSRHPILRPRRGE